MLQHDMKQCYYSVSKTNREFSKPIWECSNKIDNNSNLIQNFPNRIGSVDFGFLCLFWMNFTFSEYDWIKIDKDDPMQPPEEAPLYKKISSTSSSDGADDDIGYWRKRQDRTFPIFDADGTVLQDEVRMIHFRNTLNVNFTRWRHCTSATLSQRLRRSWAGSI